MLIYKNISQYRVLNVFIIIEYSQKMFKNKIT